MTFDFYNGAGDWWIKVQIMSDNRSFTVLHFIAFSSSCVGDLIFESNKMAKFPKSASILNW